MKALQCEFCGGKLMVKAEGIFECTSCGMLYDRSRIQEMVQEITGIVQVEGVANADSLLQRGYILLEDGEWTEADSYFEKVLSIEPKNARAYLGKLLADRRISRMKELPQSYPFVHDRNWMNAKNFSDSALAAELGSIEKDWQQHQAGLKKIVGLLQGESIIAAGREHTVGLRADGIVVACGDNNWGQCNVSDWRDIIAIAAGEGHTVGLRTDGIVVARGDNVWDQCDVSDWRDIIAIAAGERHTVCLKADGTVKKMGESHYNSWNISDWQDIVAIAAGPFHTVGLKEDGTVVCCGGNPYSHSRFETPNWHSVVAIAAGGEHTVGLRADGTVVACGNNGCGQCDVSDWRGIVAIAAGGEHTVGLKADGIVVACGKDEDGQCGVSDWWDIVAIAGGGNHTVGLRADGTVVACGGNGKGQCGVSSWRLFKNEADLKAAIERNRAAHAAAVKRANEERIAAEEAWRRKYVALHGEKGSLNRELANLKGLFTGSRRKEIEARLAEIDGELKKLNR